MRPTPGFLYQRSIEIILVNQSPSGAYLASPNFPVYQYSWFRDGSYIAYAMDVAGWPESSERFHDWAAAVINRRADIVARVVGKASLGQAPGKDILRARYTLDGDDDSGSPAPDGTGIVDWTHYQLDGLGAWLWALERHVCISGCRPKAEWLAAAQRATEYLQALWKLPCYDCWEEFPDRVHTHTLAAIYGGLKAQASLAGVAEKKVLHEIREFLLSACVRDGCFTKSVGQAEVDASLAGLYTPFRVVSPESPEMARTMARIEERLIRGGIHRYPQDTYYGGGEWVVLAGWLGLYYAETGSRAKAERLLEWMEGQAGPEGELPEQVPATLIDPAWYEPWSCQWGPIAKPLLWSHAMYILLVNALATSNTENR